MRYGYGRIPVVLRQEGWMINSKRPRRLYVGWACYYGVKRPAEGLGEAAEDRCPAIKPNQPWQWTLSMISWRWTERSGFDRSSTSS